MAAILKLRRGTSTPTLVESELFFNQSDTTLEVGTSLTNITLVKIGENSGSISFSGDITASNLSLSGNANISGNVTLGGSIYLGDGDSTDEIIVNASLSGSLVPDTDALYDLGSTSFRYNNLHVVSASIENLMVGGSGILSSSQQITDYNIFLEINGDNVVSGSSQINVNNTQNFTPFSSSVDMRLFQLEGFSSSLDSIYATEDELNTATQSLSASITITNDEQDVRLDNIETFTASLDVTYEEIASSTHTLVSGSSQVDLNDTQNFTPFSSSVDTRLDKVEFTSSLNETNITELFFTTSNHESRVVDLELTGSDHEDRIDLLESFSSSLDNTFVTETELNDATSSLSASLTETDVDFESRIDTLETTFSSSVDSRLTAQELFSESLDSTFLNTNGDNVISGSDQVTSSLDLRYEEKASATHTLISGSTQFTNGSGILSSSNENFTTFSSSIDDRVNIIETTFSTSVDLRLDEIETTFSTSVDDQLTQIHAYTSSLKTSIDVSGTDLIVLGNLTVQGTQTSLNTTETFIEDKTLTIASGSTTSAEADGAGIIIDGANKSIVWNHTEQVFELNTKVSSSVGFKGDGSELENVTAVDVEYLNVLNKPTLVSGSSQISYPLISNIPSGIVSGSSQVNADSITNFDSNVKDKMNLDNVISGSSQILNGSGILSSSNENFTTFSSSVDNRLDTIETTFSSSVDSRLDFIEGDFSSSVDSRLEAQEIFSASLDNEFLNTNGDNVVSGSEQVTSSLDLRYEEIGSLTHTLVSGSSQIDVTQTNNIETIATTGSNIFIGNQEITGSIKSSGSVSFEGIPWPSIGSESHILKTEPYTLNLLSGDRIYDYAGIALEHYEESPGYYHNSIAIYSFDNHDTPSYGTEFNVGPLRNHMRVYPSSSSEVLDESHMANISIEDLQNGETRGLFYADNLQIGVFNSEAITLGNSSSHIYINGTELVTDTPISSSNFISASFFIGDGSKLENIVASEITYENITGLPSGIVSGSSQIDVTQTTNYSSIRQYDNSDNTAHLNSLGVISGSVYSSDNQGILISDINGIETTTDLGLSITSEPSFSAISLTSLAVDLSETEYTVLLLSSSNEVIQGELGSAAFYHVSNSIDDGNPLVLGNAGAVKTYVDAKIIAASAGDITEVNAGPGLGGGSTIGAATLNLDTGSQHFIEGVNGIAPTLPEGLVSGSDQVTQSLDLRYVTKEGDNVISGSLFVEDIDDGQERVIFEVNNREATIFQVNNDIYATNHGAEIIMNLSNGYGLLDGDITITGDLTVTGTTTTINTTNLNVEDNVIELNYGGSATNGGILVKDTNGTLTSGSLLWDSTTDSWIAGPLGFETRILTTADNVITDSNIDSKIKLKLDNDNVHSGSYLGTATTSDLDEGINLYYNDTRVKNKLNNDSVISGSTQITNNSGILSSSNENFTDFSSSVDSRFGALSTDYNDLQNVPSGIVSSSTQISNFNTFLEKNNNGVISGSEQIDVYDIDNFIVYSSSVDARIDLLESFSSSLDAGFVTEAELNTATQSLKEFVDLKLNNDDVHSGSYLGTATTSDLSEGVNLYYNDNRVKTKLDADGVISGSTFTTFSSSVDARIDLLESFSSSLDAGFVTEAELNTATQSLQDSIDLKLNITSYTTDSSSFDSRIDSLEGVTSENPLTFSDTSTIDLTRVGDTITADVIGGVVSGSSQVIDILNSLNSYTSSNDTLNTTQDGRLDSLETYTGSVDSLYEEKASSTHTLVSGSTQITNNSGILSSSNEDFTTFSSSVDTRIDSLEGDIHTHANKANLDTINQDLSTTSNITFGDLNILGTGSFGTDVTIYGDLTVLGTETIINTTNLAIQDNMIYLNSGSIVTNPDLGWSGNYNDGVYAHAGMFRDASDNGIFKIYDGYTPEPEGDIDTTHTSFNLADLRVNNSYVNKIDFMVGGISSGSIQSIGDDLGIVSKGGISLVTSGGGDGVLIDAAGNTTIYGQLNLQEAPAAGSTPYALVWDNTDGGVKYRTLGSNAFNSTDYLSVNGDNVISGSSQVDVTQTTNYSSINQYSDTKVKTKLDADGVISGSDFTSPSQGTLSAVINGNTQSVDLGLQTTDDVSFNTLNIDGTTQSTNITSGALIVDGGVGIAKTLNVGEDIVAYASSDRRLKDNILPISNPLQKINSIGGYSFDWNVEKQHIYKGKDYGVIAQEIEEILPELVDTRENGYKAVKYDKLVSLLIEGIKELSTEVEQLKQQINK